MTQDMLEFDYLVLGGGSAGSVVASRLSERPDVTVALVEAGNKGAGWVVNTPIAGALMVPSRLNNWAFKTVPQKGLNGRPHRLSAARACTRRFLGGQCDGLCARAPLGL